MMSEVSSAVEGTSRARAWGLDVAPRPGFDSLSNPLEPHKLRRSPPASGLTPLVFVVTRETPPGSVETDQPESSRTSVVVKWQSEVAVGIHAEDDEGLPSTRSARHVLNMHRHQEIDDANSRVKFV